MPQAKDLSASDQIKTHIKCVLILVLMFTLAPILAHADVDGSLRGVRDKLTNVILPVLSVIGIAIAGLSFITGHENAKKHIIYAIIGTAIGFGAQSIVNMIQQTVR